LKKLKIFKDRQGHLISNAYAAGEHVQYLDDENHPNIVEEEKFNAEDASKMSEIGRINKSLGPLPPVSTRDRNQKGLNMSSYHREEVVDSQSNEEAPKSFLPPINLGRKH
jgi:hypothetical protein